MTRLTATATPQPADDLAARFADLGWCCCSRCVFKNQWSE